MSNLNSKNYYASKMKIVISLSDLDIYNSLEKII